MAVHLPAIMRLELAALIIDETEVNKYFEMTPSKSQSHEFFWH